MHSPEMLVYEALFLINICAPGNSAARPVGKQSGKKLQDIVGTYIIGGKERQSDKLV